MEIYGLCEKNKRLSIYKINSIEWDGEEYKENGILCRNAVAKGNKVVNDYLMEQGAEGLPVTLVDGEVVVVKSYPTNKQLSEWTGVQIDFTAVNK